MKTHNQQVLMGRRVFWWVKPKFIYTYLILYVLHIALERTDQYNLIYIKKNKNMHNNCIKILWFQK